MIESNITRRMVRPLELKLITHAGETPDQLFDVRRDSWTKCNLAGESR